MRKTGFVAALCLCGLLLWAGVASAHVVVYPQQTTQGSYEKFAVRVPSESSSSNTVKVEVRFNPAEVTISRFEPKPGWTYQATKDASGAITSVVWTAQGDGLSPTEFAEFYMQGKVGDKAASITWKAYQTYKDGSVVEWVGAAGSDKPASVTQVAAKPAGADSHSHDTGQAAGMSSAANAEGRALPLVLSIVGVVLGAIALIVALLRRRA